MPPKRHRSSFPASTGALKEFCDLRHEYYPAFLNLRDKLCVVVGGGKVAGRKVSALVKSGASVRVVSPDLTTSLQRLKASGKIGHVPRKYRKGDLRGAFLSIAATSDEAVNRMVSSEAPCLVNVVDAPGLCNFIAPAMIKRGPLTIAVSTGGASPAMASNIRKDLESVYGKEIGIYLLFLKRLRKEIMEEISDAKLREGLLKQAASREILAMLKAEGFQEARRKVMESLSKVRRKGA